MSLLFRQPVNHLVVDKKDEVLVLEPESIPANASLYFKGLHNCTVTVKSPCTKVFLEDCHNSSFSFHSRIVTQIAEVWRSTLLSLTIDTPILTLQVDECDSSKVEFLRKELFETLVWSKCENLALTVQQQPATVAEDGPSQEVAATVVDPLTVTVGLESAKELHKPEFEIIDTDQFIVRVIDGVLKSEVIVRVGGGFATTTREDDAHAAKEKRDLAKLTSIVKGARRIK
ncbi:hypothetical protein BDR26DRAFT_914441 [Obelidium mucronatum]|nr:hypothetical protein BDR26DRAFT_914441 [Obelidium mucronatum]